MKKKLLAMFFVGTGWMIIVANTFPPFPFASETEKSIKNYQHPGLCRDGKS